MEVILLIQQAYRDAQLLAEEGESLTSVQGTTGTRLLNRILRQISTDGFQIPLITEESFLLTSSVDTLELPGWAKLEKVGYFLGDVLVDIDLQDVNTFYNNAVIRTSTGTPFIGYSKRIPTGILLRLFLTPNVNYQIEIRGYKILNTVTLTDTIDLDSIEGFMIDYLNYRLSVDLQMDAQLQTISKYLLLKAKEYEEHYNRLKFTRIDRRKDKMGERDGKSGRSLSGYGLSQGWTY